MTFAIATSEQNEAHAQPESYDGRVSFRGFAVRADRKARQIIAAIECCETPQEVDDTLVEEDLILDALLLDFPDLYDTIRETADGQKAILSAGIASATDTGAPVAMTPTAQSNVLNKTF